MAMLFPFNSVCPRSVSVMPSEVTELIWSARNADE